MNVFKNIMEIRTKDADQNVLETQTVQSAKHVCAINAKIHALACAVLKPFAQSRIIFRFVIVHQEQLAMHSVNVLPLSLKRSHYRRKIRAIRHHAASIQFVVSVAIQHFVNAFQAIPDHRLALDVIQNVSSVQIVHAQKLASTINASIHVQMFVVMVLFVRLLITVQFARVQNKLLAIHSSNAGKFYNNQLIHVSHHHVGQMVFVVLLMMQQFARILNVLQTMIAPSIEVVSIRSVTIHVSMLVA